MGARHMRQAAPEGQDVITTFTAMGSPCAVIVDTDDRELGLRLGEVVAAEARRIEEKYSRYRPSLVTTINASGGRPIELDRETADLIDYAVRCHELSDGKFDITSGALRRVWSFNRGSVVPSQDAIAGVMEFVGWHRVTWKRPWLTLPPGMEIDLGGIGKEYAVDRAIELVSGERAPPLLVNFGGDLRVTRPHTQGGRWRVGIEDVDAAGSSAGLIGMTSGALATSGDSQRFLIHEGKRYGHVLDPGTGWPVVDAPRSVTVHAASCTGAGMFAKLALLRGADAESFLEAEGIRAWCMR